MVESPNKPVNAGKYIGTGSFCNTIPKIPEMVNTIVESMIAICGSIRSLALSVRMRIAEIPMST